MGVKGKYLKVFRASLFGTGLVFAGGIAFFSTDLLASKFIERYRPELERKLSEQLGHPLLIGQYKGLRSWGVSFGTTKLLPGYKDQSTVEVTNLSVQFAPISSVLSRRPNLILTLNGAEVNLKRNNSGSYWNFGPTKSNRSQDLGLHLRLNEPAKIFVEPVNLFINVTSKLNLDLANKKIKGRALLDLPKHGSITLMGNGNWNKFDFQAKASLKRFELKPLEGFLPPQLKLKTKGVADGTFRLGIKEDGRVDCKGQVVVSDLNVKGSLLREAITSDKIGIYCNNDLLELPITTLNYGLWKATLRGDIPLEDPNNLNLGLFSTISLSDTENTAINLDALLPFRFDKKKLVTGSLLANYELDSFPLTSLSSIINKPIAGNLSANGIIQGPFSSLNTNFAFSLENPQFTRIRLQEKWEGEFLGTLGGGGELRMKSIGAALPSTISAKLKDNWELDNLLVQRLGGTASLDREFDRYKWIAKNFRLDRIELAIPPAQSFKRIFGQLSGEGTFNPNPLIIDGKVSLGYPRLIGVKLKEAQVKGSYSDKNYSLEGDLFPLDSGQISILADGIIGGSLWAKTELKKVSPSWLIKSALQLPNVNIEVPFPKGRAEDLGKVSISSKEGSLDNQIRTWVRSVISVSQDRQRQNTKEFIDPDLVKGYVDGILEVKGSDLARLKIDLNASGKLWTKKQNQSNELEIIPFTATIKGPLQFGEGEFSLVNIPFSLLSLFIPSPSSLSGMFGFTGRYRLGKGKQEVNAELVFNKVGLGENKILLNRGSFYYSDSILKLDLSLQNASSSEPITVFGQIPLVPSLPIDLRIESHGDGISFLDKFLDGTLTWNKGSADLRFLLTGTIENPYANGFLVFQNAELVVKEKVIKDLNGTMVFDFNRVEVQQLNAKIGDEGTITGSGNIALFSSGIEEKIPLAIKVKNVRLKSSFADTEIFSNLELRGALVKPLLGGEITLSKGSISTQRKTSNKADESFNQTNSSTYRTTSLPEQNWNRKSPLVLFIRDENAPASKMINSAIPKGFSSIGFENLRLNLGPRLQIVSPPVTSFEVDGFLLLNGALDQSLNASGVVRLLNGRVNLFTTTFILDRREQNVAIFVPSMGLVPYVDVKLTTRVPDTVRDPTGINSSSDFNTNGSGAFGIGGSRFVKVEVMATGPADRLKDNYQLRSTPPIPESELLGLIGGNSLAGLFEGRDSTVFADILNRSLVSPILGNISGALSERLQIALYPAYVNAAMSNPETVDNPSATNTQEDSGNLSPDQAWVTEIGIDLTDRISFSLQSTPNREDIPSQGNLTLQLNQNIGVLGSFDQNGNWQSQLEIFVRY